MENLLADKNILVIGAGGLLGSTLVAELLNQNARVIAADINLEIMSERLRSININIRNSNIHLLQCNIVDKESVKKVLDSALEIDGAVNTTYPRNNKYGSHFFDVSLESFNENLSLHLGSSFLFMQQCAAYFLKNKKPFSLVNISSIYGVIAPKFKIYEKTSMTMPVEYAAIKSAILHLNKYVISYINDSKFRINCVSPGGILDSQPEEFLSAYKANTHGEGMLNVKEIIGSIMFLLSEQSQYVTGQNIIVDDGFSL